jgi:DNA-binding NtrC family response regulator
MQPTQPKPRPLHVAIVSKNAETLEGLEAYLRGAGVLTSSTRAIARAAELGASASALVLFPDDYTWDGAVAALTKCRTQNPRAPLVLVTRTPQRFEALAGPDDGALTVVVPKPAWSWTILDAIRAHIDDEPERESD